MSVHEIEFHLCRGLTSQHCTPLRIMGTKRTKARLVEWALTMVLSEIITLSDASKPRNVFPRETRVDEGADGSRSTLVAVDFLVRLGLDSSPGVFEFHSHVLTRDKRTMVKQVLLVDHSRTFRTFSRRPNCGASTVINNAFTPRFSACWTIFFVFSLSLFT